MSAPFFSVILPCRNAAPTLGAALDSLAAQTWRDHEALVLNGGTDAATADLLQARRDDRLVVFNEPDSGVYEAMNKGAKRARGQWLLFLGADDVLAAPDVFARVAGELRGRQGGLVCGEAVYRDGRVWRAPVRPALRYGNFLHHQACFYHRDLFTRYAYDETFPIQADYELNLRLWHAGIRPLPLAVRVSLCGTGGLSDGGRWANYRDEIRARHRYFPAWQCWPWDLLAVARFVRKQFVHRRPASHE